MFFWRCDLVVLAIVYIQQWQSWNFSPPPQPLDLWIRVVKRKIRTGPDSVLLAETGSRGAWPKNASSPQVPPTGNACPVCWRLCWWKEKRLVRGVWSAMEEEDGWSTGTWVLYGLDKQISGGFQRCSGDRVGSGVITQRGWRLNNEQTFLNLKWITCWL